MKMLFISVLNATLMVWRVAGLLKKKLTTATSCLSCMKTGI